MTKRPNPWAVRSPTPVTDRSARARAAASSGARTRSTEPAWIAVRVGRGCPPAADHESTRRCRMPAVKRSSLAGQTSMRAPARPKLFARSCWLPPGPRAAERARTSEVNHRVVSPVLTGGAVTLVSGEKVQVACP